MGVSVSTGIAWGIDVSALRRSGALVSSEDFEGEVAALFGFTEPPPPYLLPDTATPQERWAWRREVREPWRQRLSAAVPLALKHHGEEFEGVALVLKRSLTQLAVGVQEVDPARLAEPARGEAGAFDRVLDRLGHDGDRTLRLLLLAHYG